MVSDKNILDNKIAVVGMGGVFPDAANIDQFWHNIVNKHVSIKRHDDNIVDSEIFYRPEMLGKIDKKDKTYTFVTANVKSFDFESREFKIAPAIAKHMDDNQKISLLSARQAIAGGALDSVNKERVSVFMGNTMIGALHHDFQERFNFERFTHHLNKNSIFGSQLTKQEKSDIISDLHKKILSKTFPVTEDSAPGILPNIIASRICSVFDLHGHAYVIDAACASALAAIICGIQQLRSFEADAIICGAVDMLNREAGLIYFSGINALSPDGSYPFDERANGFVIGQGGGTVVLKRLSDAINSGDTIYAVITGYGQASDGKGKAIAAPNELWQAKTIQRAYEMTGYPVDTIELIEAHGTSTQVGDLSEVTALKRAFSNLGVTGKRFCGLGSVKSNIGHLKSAAGIAGFLKTVLALHHKILPPTAGFERENLKLNLADSPFYIIKDALEWKGKSHPRRAGVNAFGFGGADYHITLQEYRREDYTDTGSKFFASVSFKDNPLKNDNGTKSRFAFFSSDTTDGIVSQMNEFTENVNESTLNKEYLYQCLCADPHKKFRLAFSFDSVENLLQTCEVIKANINDPNQLNQFALKGIFWSSEVPFTNDQLAFLFPGQGSQYADMLLDIRSVYSPAEIVFSRFDAQWRKLTGKTVTDLIDSSISGNEETEKLLKKTANTHPAMMTADLALFSVLQNMNIRPSVMIGHSLGEVIALAAAGKIPSEEALPIIFARGTSFETIEESKAGAMAALAMGRHEASDLIASVNPGLTIANINSGSQTIVSGDANDIEDLIKHCDKIKIKVVRLNVSHAFHSPLMKPAEDKFKKYLETATFENSRVKVIANQTNEYYGEDSESVRNLLSTQITGTVNYVDSVLKLYNDGIRLFVEVGPGNVLSSLTKKILEGTQSVILTSDNKTGSSIESFHKMLCRLFTAGIKVEPIPQNVRNVNTNFKAVQSENLQVNSVVSPVVNKENVVYSGTAAGLPGSFKRSFRDDNCQQLFEGRNFIERLTDAEREALVEMKISRLNKSEEGASFHLLDSINEVIQLAGKIGQIDLLNDYLIEKKDIQNISGAIGMAIAAGYEALRDAHIPLIHEYSKTSSGSLLPERWVLPQEMQSETGIIFANGFPMLDPVINEVSRHLSYKLGNKLKSEIFEFYEAILEKISDKESKKILADWYALNFSRLCDRPTENDVYTFNHHLMNQISSQANNRFAQLINARGPNFQINAACSSTTTALTLAEEMITSGRVKRMIVIGADDPSTKSTLPYIGAAFLSTGACTQEADLYEAAIPFDKRRNGMIMSSGAIGIVLETESECQKRGVVPICELMGSHCFNTAAHPSQLDVSRYAEELEVFMSKMENMHHIDRHRLADQMLYMSHETYTPARGGCSESEAVSLRHVFGDDFRKIEISNTKGMTGHTMGASIEDFAAAKSLQYSKIPPVVNHKVIDPVLEGLKLSKGGDHKCTYALRMAAGFGSQGNYLLLKKIADKDTRISNQEIYKKWLSSISGISEPEITYRGRTLVVKDSKPGSVICNRPQIDISYRSASGKKKPIGSETVITPRTDIINVSKEKPQTKSNNLIQSIILDVKDVVLSIIAEVSGYSVDMLAPDMEIEADLGIDTVKQATILARIGEQLDVNRNGGFRISEFPKIQNIIDFFNNKRPNESESECFQIETVNEIKNKLVSTASTIKKNYKSAILSVIGDVTGYPKEMLEPDMELEADLGIDTVKQATILALLSEKFGMSKENGFKISDFPTINHIVSLFSSSPESSNASVTILDEPFLTANSSRNIMVADEKRTDVKKEVLKVISDVTGYSEELLGPEMEIEADLGIDTVKQATILALLGEKFGVNNEAGFKISEFPTVNHIIELFSHFQECSEPGDIISAENYKSTASEDRRNILVSTETKPDVKREVLKVVSEVTGYSDEMLEPEMEIEADLGIDTVKQATILAILGEKFGVNNEVGFKISEFPTIKHIVELFSKNISNMQSTQNSSIGQIGTVITSKLSENPSITAPDTNNDRSVVNGLQTALIIDDSEKEPLSLLSIQEKVIQIFTENTSYPPEMLEMDLRTKSDLGLKNEIIESIQSKIISTFHLTGEWKIGNDDQLGGIIASIETIWNKVAFGFDSIDLARQVLSFTSAPLKEKTINLADKRLLVIGDNEHLVKKTVKYFSAKTKSVEHAVFPMNGEFEETVKVFSKLKMGGVPDILVDITGCGTEQVEFVSQGPAQVDAMISRAADCRFAMSKYLQENNLIPHRILAVLSVDGTFGIDTDDNSPINPVFGLYNGFYKALKREWSKSTISIVDAGQLDGKKPEILAEIIENEICSECEEVEIGYKENSRAKIITEDRPFDYYNGSPVLNRNDVVIVTGGGAGITSKVICELAQQYPATFIIIGRTELVDNVKLFADMDESNLQEQKIIIRDRLKGENKRVTPVMVEREFTKIEKSVEIFRTIQFLEKCGCRAAYYNADIREINRVKEILNDVRAQFGAISGIIHGAGVEISHTIEQKTIEEFHTVNSIKTSGAYILSSLCKDDPLKVVIAFSSISGLFGNAAQVDYSAANCFLNFWARMYKRQGINAKSLIWSGWRETGMAWKNSFVKENAETMGLNLLDPQQGARAAVREIATCSDKADVIIHNGLGAVADPMMCSVDLTSFPMIDRLECDSEGVCAVHRRVSPKRDVLLDQHRLSGTPLMPGVGFMEMMAESLSVITKKKTGACIFKNIEFSDAFKLYREEPRDVTIEIRKKGNEFAMIVKSPLKTVLSKDKQMRIYSTSDIFRGNSEVVNEDPKQWFTGDLKKVCYKKLLNDAFRFKQNVIFGPLFNDAKREGHSENDNTVFWGNDGLITEIRFPIAQLTNPRYPLEKLLLNPCFLDSIHQAGAVYGILTTNQVYLPSGAEEFIVNKIPKSDGKYRIYAKAKSKTDEKIIYDIAMLDDEDEIICYVRNSLFRRIHQ